MIKTFAFLAFLFHVSCQQVDVELLERNLQNATNLIIAKERRVSSIIFSCKANAAVTSLNFKAINASKMLTDSFDAMANLTIKLQTVKEFENHANCQYLTTCECILFRTVLCDAQIKEIDGVAQSINLNASLFYQTFSDIIWSYMVNYKPIQSTWTREVAILKTFNQSRLVMTELSDFNRVIFETRKYFVNALDFLGSQSLNCSTENSTFNEEGNLIEDRLREAEDKLLYLVEIAYDKVNISLSTVSSAKKVQNSMTAKSALSSLRNQLKKQKTCKDYRDRKVSWPRIPDTSGRATGFMKVRTSKAKKKSYSFSKNSAAANKTKIKEDLEDFKNSTGSTSSSIQKRSITLQSSSQDIDVITATGNVLNQFDVYIQELTLAIAKVDNMTRKYELEMISLPTCPIPVVPNLGTLGPLNTAMCYNLLDIFDGFGCYLKTTCRITIARSSDNAATICRQGGGNLYGPTSVDEINGLQYFVNNVWGPVESKVLHIGGRRLANGSWFFGDQPIHPDAIPASANIKGDCLQLGKSNNRFRFIGGDCASWYEQICEITKPIIPQQIVRTNVCNKIGDINGPSGYIKTACAIHMDVNRGMAKGACQSNGMRLFAVTSADDYNGLMKFATQSYLVAHPFHVSGERMTDGSWKVDQPYSVPLYYRFVPTTIDPCVIFQVNATIGLTRFCSDYFYAMCEFVKPKVPATIKPVPPGCDRPFNTFSPDGKYLKTACKTNLLTFAGADAYCKSIGTYLFGINTVDDYNNAMAYSNEVYGVTRSSIPIIVGGNKAANGTWFTYTPNPKPLFTGIPAVGNGSVITFDIGIGNFGGFRAVAASSTADAFCEINRMV